MIAYQKVSVRIQQSKCLYHPLNDLQSIELVKVVSINTNPIATVVGHT